ncbi:MAG: hypothetical protein HZA52_09560 [Planctomycetes bacterium]|nr:hypothetical protein [Planctomycetota bacterium]
MKSPFHREHSRDEPRAVVELWGERVRYAFDRELVREFELRELVAVGERWFAPMHLEDEHYLVLVLPDGGWLQLGELTLGRERLVRALEALHGTRIEFECLGSGDDQGRMLLPERLKGRPLFHVEPLERAGWWGRVIDRFDPRITWRLTDELEALARVDR